MLLTLLYLFFPFFKLKGSSEVNVEVNQKYIEKGYITNGKIIDVFDDIDTKKIGKYHVYYKYFPVVSLSDWKICIKRKNICIKLG